MSDSDTNELKDQEPKWSLIRTTPATQAVSEDRPLRHCDNYFYHVWERMDNAAIYTNTS